MLTENNYQIGLKAFEKLKYNINFCKNELFNIVCMGLANTLLNHPYSDQLTEDQRIKLSNLTAK